MLKVLALKGNKRKVFDQIKVVQAPIVALCLVDEHVLVSLREVDAVVIEHHEADV